MGKTIEFKEIIKLLDTTDKGCYEHFKLMLEAKYALRKGKDHPQTGFRAVFKAIWKIEEISNNLKHYRGFLEAKKEITVKYYKYLETNKTPKQ